jgi:hypothetical protein
LIKIKNSKEPNSATDSLKSEMNAKIGKPKDLDFDDSISSGYDPERFQRHDNWVDFYQANNSADFGHLINCGFTNIDNFSPNFIDFLQECLMMDVNER